MRSSRHPARPARGMSPDRPAPSRVAPGRSPQFRRGCRNRGKEGPSRMQGGRARRRTAAGARDWNSTGPSHVEPEPGKIGQDRRDMLGPAARGVSISSIRIRNRPPLARARSWARMADKAWPRWSWPVGPGREAADDMPVSDVRWRPCLPLFVPTTADLIRAPWRRSIAGQLSLGTTDAGPNPT